MPRYRELLWVEGTIDHCLSWISANLRQLISSTTPEQLLQDTHKFMWTLFLTAALFGLVWLVALNVPVNVDKQTMSTPPVRTDDDAFIIGPKTPSVTQSDKTTQTPFAEELQFKRDFFPNISSTKDTSPSIPPDEDTKKLGDQTEIHDEHLSVSEHDTPFTTATPNFSNLAQNAPTAYKTLQEIGMLNADGTPTRQWIMSKRMPSGGRLESQPVAETTPIVAWWVCSTKNEQGRAALRRELDEEDQGWVRRLGDEQFV